jgi:hypothetical protein
VAGRRLAINGLSVGCEIGRNVYPTVVMATDDEMRAINITRDAFHGEWNYSIAPDQQPP